MSKFIQTAMCVATLWQGIMAQEFELDSLLNLNGLKIGGNASFTAMRIVKSSAIPNIESDQPFLNHAWIQTIRGSISAQKKLGKTLTLATGIGGMILPDIQGSNVNWQRVLRRTGAYVNAASADFRFGSMTDPVAQLKLGYFGYSYHQTCDFGGYLYTSGLYPMYLSASGGVANIAGFLARFKYPTFLSHDLIIDFETNRQPYMDLSLAYIPTLKLGTAVEIGAGVKACRIIPAGNEKLNPELVYTSYYTTEKVPKQSGTGDTTVCVETTMPYKGVKLMGRASVDFKNLFGLTGNFWGTDDLRLYGELAVQGLKDYPANTEGRGYNNIRERIPVMAGLTMPTHPVIGNFLVPAGVSLFLIGIEADSISITESTKKANSYDTAHFERGFTYKPYRPYLWVGTSLLCGALTTVLEKSIGRHFRLDKITLEAEYCASPYNNNHTAPSTLPEFIYACNQETGKMVGTSPWHKDDWRWAVAADKKVFKNISINLKLASSHITVRDPQGFNTILEWLYAYYEWYWQMGVYASF